MKCRRWDSFCWRTPLVERFSTCTKRLRKLIVPSWRLSLFEARPKEIQTLGLVKNVSTDALVMFNVRAYAVSFRIKADRFIYWAQEIITLFPNEVKETYYIPYMRGPDGPLSARGILWSKYTNRRRTLRGKGILEPKKVRSKAVLPEGLSKLQDSQVFWTDPGNNTRRVF